MDRRVIERLRAERDQLRAAQKSLVGFIRQIFGPKYDAEIAALLVKHGGEQ